MPKSKYYPLVADFNDRELEDLRENFVPKHLIEEPFKARDGRNYKATFESPNSLDEETFLTCFQLIKDGCKDMYDRSEMRWSDQGKKTEMKEKGMNFLILRDSESNELAGFLSILVTVEAGEELLYCYELHIAPAKHGLGLGRYLMEIFEEFGKRIGFVRLAMLTVFTENKPARAFYAKLGYELDQCSPGPRHLRNGVIKQPTYQILSKIINEDVRYETVGYEELGTPEAE